MSREDDRAAVALHDIAVLEAAHEYVAATQAYEDDRYSPGWTERAGRAHLARAALWGACGYVNACENDEPAVLGEQLPGITP